MISFGFWILLMTHVIYEYLNDAMTEIWFMFLLPLPLLLFILWQFFVKSAINCNETAILVIVNNKLL